MSPRIVDLQRLAHGGHYALFDPLSAACLRMVGTLEPRGKQQ